MSLLDDVLARVNELPEATKKELIETAIEATKDRVWIPSPGPQTEAYYSEADILLYGGEPGGGKSSLILGLAFEEHQRSLILRRQYTDLGHIIEEALKFNGGKAGFNGSPPPKLKRGDKVIDFGAASRVGDEQHWQGNPHDLIGIDEATQFAEIQVRFLMGWLRNADNPDQRKRVVMATNPALDAEGLWVTEMFAPWLDEKFVNPAKPGELRWAYVDKNDKEVWVDGPESIYVEEFGKEVSPRSYTYIPASLHDNPFLVGTGYEKQLDSMGSIRDLLMGGFRTDFKDDPDQIIPTEWVRLAQQRWRPERTELHVPMCAMGVDCTGGGNDPMVIAPRYDGWFSELIEIPGESIPKESQGQTAAGHVVAHRANEALVVVDLGGGYGNALYERLIENGIAAKGYMGSEGTTRRSGQLKFKNVRTAALWGMREALDPGQPGGSPIALPPGRKLLADLTAPHFKIQSGMIVAESKEDIRKRLGRSTNDGDAVMMSWFYGPKEVNSALEWAGLKEQQKMKRMGGTAPKVILSHRRRR